jgi:hypothetical protein
VDEATPTPRGAPTTVASNTGGGGAAPISTVRRFNGSVVLSGSEPAGAATRTARSEPRSIRHAR